MFIIFDLEFTSWPGAQDRGWTGAGEYREIVQIGAIRVDSATLSVTAEFDVLVRPAHNPRLSEFFEKLTGITNADLTAKGQEFAPALNAFLEFCAGDYAVSYGNDMVIIGENIILQFPPDEAPAMALPPFANVRPHINTLIPATVPLPAGLLHEGLTDSPDLPQGPAHNALADCYGILAALRQIRRQGHPLIAL